MLKCCINCGKGFSTEKSKYFCSKVCEIQFKNKRKNDNEEWLNIQEDMDFKAKQKAKDYRIPRR